MAKVCKKIYRERPRKLIRKRLGLVLKYKANGRFEAHRNCDNELDIIVNVSNSRRKVKHKYEVWGKRVCL